MRVAVASNFAEVHEQLARRFEAETNIGVRASLGSTGLLYAQIRNGAPFDVFLAADDERPARLVEEGWAEGSTRFTYAEGRLALYAPGRDSVRAGGADLRDADYTFLAIAHPRTAPYGAAAEEVLARLGSSAAVAGRVVYGENIAHAYQFVRSGAAELAFVALSQVIREPPRSYWRVPPELHAPIRQDAVLLRGGTTSAAARAYLEFLKTPEARELIESYGYAAPP